MGTVQEDYQRELVLKVDRGITRMVNDHRVSDYSPEAREAAANAALRAVEATARVNDRLAPFYTSERARRELGGISRQALHDRHRNHRILRVTTAEGQRLYPAFQFHQAEVPSQIAEVLQTLLSTGEDGWAVAYWMTAQLPQLEERTPAEVLVYGSTEDAATVRRMAEADASGWIAA